jgi:hypothetical protein
MEGERMSEATEIVWMEKDGEFWAVYGEPAPLPSFTEDWNELPSAEADFTGEWTHADLAKEQEAFCESVTHWMPLPAPPGEG